jgi:hypothetical protein
VPLLLPRRLAAYLSAQMFGLLLRYVRYLHSDECRLRYYGKYHSTRAPPECYGSFQSTRVVDREGAARWREGWTRARERSGSDARERESSPSATEAANSRSYLPVESARVHVLRCRSTQPQRSAVKKSTTIKSNSPWESRRINPGTIERQATQSRSSPYFPAPNPFLRFLTIYS